MHLCATCLCVDVCFCTLTLPLSLSVEQSLIKSREKYVKPLNYGIPGRNKVLPPEEAPSAVPSRGKAKPNPVAQPFDPVLQVLPTKVCE